ncbi:FUSC family protein [Paraburkholderia nemoris]|uniref:FUSC family protein n=1 Tax=Paraburkholderia nemoris TaxID=2793076 RepID=UPI0038B7A2EA
MPAHLGRLLQSLADLSPHERQFVATTGSALFFSIADLRTMCRSYVEARTRGRSPWSLSLLQAISRIGRTRATVNRAAATIAGTRAAVAVLLVGAGWIASGWIGGATAIVAVAMNLARHPRP